MDDKSFALSACVDVVVAGKNGKYGRRTVDDGTERLRSRVNRNKKRYTVVPFPSEQSIFAFQKLERRWNGAIAFPCERGRSVIFVWGSVSLSEMSAPQSLQDRVMSIVKSAKIKDILPARSLRVEGLIGYDR